MNKILYGALGLLMTATTASAQCFTPLFETGNMVPDPEMTNISYFKGSWGTAIITRVAEEVYCGNSSGKIQSGDQGSLTFPPTWKPNTNYILRAMVKTNGTFQIGVGKTYIGNGNADTDFEIPNTAEEWVPFERLFTTGDQAGAGECWFNNYRKAGTVGYIDNWELYEDSELLLSANRVTFDYLSSEKVITVSGTKVSGTVTVQIPEGIMVTPESFDFETSSTVELTIVWEESTPVNGNIVLNNSFKEVLIPVKSTDSGERFVPTELEYENLVPDPHLSDPSEFIFTGSAEILDIVSSTVTPYCRATFGKIGDNTTTCSGSIEVPEINWEPNTTYRIVFMIRGQGSYNLGMTNVDGAESQRDITVSGSPLWKKIDYTFKTGPQATKGSCYVNNCEGSTGKLGYIDNWEIYQIPNDLCD